MHRIAVHDKKHLAWHRAHQVAQKVHKHLGGETSLEYLKAQGTAVGQAGDDVATEALAGLLHDRGLALHDRGLALGRPAGAGLVVGTQAHLVAPVDLGPFSLRPQPVSVPSVLVLAQQALELLWGLGNLGVEDSSHGGR